MCKSPPSCPRPEPSEREIKNIQRMRQIAIAGLAGALSLTLSCIILEATLAAPALATEAAKPAAAAPQDARTVEPRTVETKSGDAARAIPANVAAAAQVRDAACRRLTQVYRTLTTASIPGGRDMGVSGTMFRQQTLQRLLTIAWTQQCDMGPILETEFSYIEAVLNGQNQPAAARR